eukprot:g253.t1
MEKKDSLDMTNLERFQSATSIDFDDFEEPLTEAPLSPSVMRAKKNSSRRRSLSSPRTPRTKENDMRTDLEIEMLRKSMEEAKKQSGPKIKVNIAPGSLSLRKRAVLRQTSRERSGSLSPRIVKAVTNAQRRRSSSVSESQLPTWLEDESKSTTKKITYSVETLRSFRDDNMVRPLNMPELPFHVERLMIRGNEQGLYMGSVVQNALLVLELVLDGGDSNGIRISTLGSKFKVAFPERFYRGITRDLVPVIVDAKLAERHFVQSDMFLRLTEDAVQMSMYGGRPHIIVSNEAKRKLEHAFKKQRRLTQDEEALKLPDVSKILFEDNKILTVEELLGKRLNGYVHKAGSVYGFVKTTDFEEPDLGEIFFLVREVQGKRRLPVGTKVTFVLDRKDEKMRALRVVPLSKPEEILKLEEKEREERGETEEDDQKEKEEEEKKQKVSSRWKRDDDDNRNGPTSSLFHHKKMSPKNSRSPGFRDRSSRSPPFRPRNDRSRSPPFRPMNSSSSGSRTPPGFPPSSMWPYDPTSMKLDSIPPRRRYNHRGGRRVVENGKPHQRHHKNNSHHRGGGGGRNGERNTHFNNLARGPDGSKGFGGWRRR